MATVFIRKADYDYTTLKPIIFEIMDSCGGNLINKDSRVVIKPNLLAPASPDKAIITHPLIIKAVAEYVIAKGARPQISDSQAVGSFEKILKENGINEALKGLDVELREFKETATIDTGKPFGKIEIAADIANADIVINLPKLKTHTQMMLTLGVKNLFGCIVGMTKPEWHFRTGVDRDMFARLLVRIFQTAKPTITILDGILAMEGQGPGKSGTPRKIGVIMGSNDTLAIDHTVCKMTGISPASLLTNKIAGDEGLDPGNIFINGELPEIRTFKLPEITPLVFGPKKFHNFMRRHLVQRPECNAELCKLCGECWQYCPADAIEKTGKTLKFDYEKCIRCYCCIEVCPHGALSAKETVTGKFSRKILKIS